MSFLFAAAILPAIALLVYVYNKDRVEKEPMGLLLLLFVAGAVCCFPAALIESFLDVVNTGVFSAFGVETETGIEFGHTTYSVYQIVANLFCVALVEEGLKLAALVLITRKNKNFNSLFDGLIYAVFVSLGFAAAENVMYVFELGFSVAVQRAFTAIPGHLAFSVIMGAMYSRRHTYSNASALEKDLKQRGLIAEPLRLNGAKYSAQCLILPTLAHGFYDFCCSMDSGFYTFLFYVQLIALYFYSFSTIKKLSAADVDDITAATALVAQMHPDFKELLLSRSEGAAAGAETVAAPVSAAASPHPQSGAPVRGPAAGPYRAAFSDLPATDVPTRVVHWRNGFTGLDRIVLPPDRGTYVGHFANGYADGYGKYYFPTGGSVSGVWKNGYYAGVG